ncbi:MULTISPECIES: amino acid synthesis family protein [unclassified Arthrobacter]|uniref:amino acid synthesis family protein n=1 Tax=unclassified Arthrobacter TaxID=235627 RepID=UPI00159DCFC0|nr:MULTISPECIES: amino acid synthesis family protein [unclassified Arthrobacter]MCQ9164529.1 amino acid synthesis family protein [Arthrobacter sp. STN4]NVM98228.1 amino acid synthesis family protein [Arthrobacter sp. SDTb3-6]
MAATATKLSDWLRKIVLYQEDVKDEHGAPPAVPAVRATVAAVIRNPWLGTGPGEVLAGQAEAVAPHLARALSDRLKAALGGAEEIEAFGKAAIVGTAGEIEHGGALIHTPYFGNLFREFLEGESIICFADSRSDAGQALIVPMWHKHAPATRSHYQTIAARVSDGPRPDEIVVIAAASTGPRPHARIGDRKTDQVVTAEKLEHVFA